MLPASTFAEITANLAALQLEPSIAAQILAAVFAPLLPSSQSESESESGVRQKRAGRPRSRRALQPKRKKPKRRVAATRGSADGPRQRAARALAANPTKSLTAVAEIAGVSRGTVVAARNELAAEARKPRPAELERRERAQRFLREQLGRGPKPVSDVEAAATRAHVNPETLEQARADLHVVTSRANTGGAHAVQWSLPG
jgi:hypothetical protein